MSETSVLAGNAGGGDAEVLRAPNLGALARDLLVGAFASLLVACAIECVAFNFDWLATLSVKEQPAQNLTWAYDPQAQWWIATVESTDVLKSLRVEPAEGSLEVDLYLSDEGHALPNRTGSLTPAAQDPKSQYLVTFSYGKLSSIALTCAQEQEPPICALTVNARVPLMVSYRRIALLAGLCVLAWLVRPSSQLRRIAYVGRVWSLACVWALCCVLIGLFVFENATCVRSYEPDGEGGYHTNRQYQELAVAFTRGEVCLPEQPSPELLAMDNPYDSKLRYQMGVSSLWDFAYFRGKYYCYFGVLPALVFHLPYYLATGRAFPNDWGTCISLFLFAAATIAVVHQMIRRWHSQASWADFVAMLASVLCCSWASQVAFWADYIYYLPIGLGLALAMGALAFWLRATSEELIGYPAALAGTLCATLTLACRPQFFLVCIFGLILLVDKLRDVRNRSWRVALIFVPMVVVIALVCWYNHARFGSPFDFGANYNLTSNDMTHRGSSVKRMALSLYHYLFQPLAGSHEAPFLGMSVASASGIPFAAEEMPGGFIAATPVVLVALLTPILGKEHRPLEQWLCAASVVAGIVLAVFDGEGAGVLARYFCDFGWLFGLVVARSWAVLGQELRSDGGAPAVLQRRCLWLASLALWLSCYIQLFWLLYVRLR